MRSILVLFSLLLGLAACSPPTTKTNIPSKAAEQANPTDFLRVNFEVRKNLLGKKIVNGTVLNTGKNQSYSSVTLSITCIKDGEESNTEYTLSEPLPPGGKAKFSYKPEGNPEQVKLRIASATAE
ncbi:MAG: hypothetical protein JST36_08500 [Bacteroidetes bacterium]|nr:hypothetical protein [Bacteroidota bacterium]